MRKKIINLCYNEWVKGGISLDVDIISDILIKAGFIVYFNGHNIRFKDVKKIYKVLPKLSKASSLAISCLGIKKFLVNIHLEVIKESDIRLAEKNIMIANLEWLRDRSYDLLPKMDLFFCKTNNAKQFFDKKGMPAVYISFSSISPWNDAYKQKENVFIHIAGSSVVKGTEALAKLWSRHPEWPKLTIIARPIEHLEMMQAHNLDIIGGFMGREKLKQLQNEAEVHLCPSEAEGFGHYICEALSCGAIVVTVDGEPMNELVQPDRGVLVNFDSTEPMYHGSKFTFDSYDFERKIERILSMTNTEKDQMKLSAKKWFDDNDSFFKKVLITEIEKCISHGR